MTLTDPLAALGRPVLAALAALGRIAGFAGATLFHLVRPPFYLREFGQSLLAVGYFSLPVVGRISMDLITVDVTDLASDPLTLDILCPEQGIDALAAASGTIGYEVLTSLGARHTRRYVSGSR